MKPIVHRILAPLFLLVSLHSHADENIFINFNFYPYLSDVGSDSDFTVNAAARLPARFSYFGFADFGGLFHSGNLRFQISEQNLRWSPASGLPLDLVIQDTIRDGSSNDTVQLGIRWRASQTPFLEAFFRAIHLRYSVNLFPLRADQRDVGGWQISHAYLLVFPYLSDRLYLGGFIDQNIDETPLPGVTRSPVVSENQLGLRLYRKLYAVAEYRINEYRPGDTTNLGIGLEIKTSW